MAKILDFNLISLDCIVCFALVDVNCFNCSPSLLLLISILRFFLYTPIYMNNYAIIYDSLWTSVHWVPVKKVKKCTHITDLKAEHRISPYHFNSSYLWFKWENEKKMPYISEVLQNIFLFIILTYKTISHNHMIYRCFTKSVSYWLLYFLHSPICSARFSINFRVLKPIILHY